MLLGTSRLRALRRGWGLVLARSLRGVFQFDVHAHGHRRMTERVGAAAALAVIIGAPGGDETVPAAEVLIMRRLRRGVLGVDRLDPHEAGLDQLGNQRVAIRESRMREDRHTARTADDAYRLGRREPLARDVGRAVDV